MAEPLRAATPLRGRVLRPRWDVAVAVFLALLVAYGLGTEKTFGNTLNISFLLGNTTTIAIVALPMTLLVAAGEVDLSVGSMAGLSGAVMGALWNANWPIQAIIPFCLAVGLAGGLLNGLLVTRLGLPSLAVTIGTLTLFRGVAQIVLGADAVSDFPQSYLDFGTGRIGGSAIPYIFVLYLVLLAIAAIVLHATPFGRRLFATGANPEAAFFAGVRVKRTKLIMFAATGLVSGGAGVIWALHYTSARYDNATGLELSVIAAVLLGGVDFDGGRGTLGGAVAGVFLLGTVQNLLSLKNVSADSQTIVTGLLLIASVLGPRVGRQAAESYRRWRVRPQAETAPDPASSS
ncbi:MAG TPA: ABC transporter permease [Actinocrinis sp.]|uniref:ABC transporter permease n=1 Tax=Actinocrinis sp. TaxID=1920516 RepID=UPI002DDD24B6|nr:ABC transporter permease [Actinocrinis sp.]HEV3170673.1 ABC transporter permease [Actinocrinis sp.]